MNRFALMRGVLGNLEKKHSFKVAFEPWKHYILFFVVSSVYSVSTDSSDDRRHIVRFYEFYVKCFDNFSN